MQPSLTSCILQFYDTKGRLFKRGRWLEDRRSEEIQPFIFSALYSIYSTVYVVIHYSLRTFVASVSVGFCAFCFSLFDRAEVGLSPPPPLFFRSRPNSHAVKQQKMHKTPWKYLLHSKQLQASMPQSCYLRREGWEEYHTFTKFLIEHPKGRWDGSFSVTQPLSKFWKATSSIPSFFKQKDKKNLQ